MNKKKYAICLSIVCSVFMIIGICLYIFIPGTVNSKIEEKVCNNITSFKNIIIEGGNIDVEIKSGSDFKVSYLCLEENVLEITQNGHVLRIEKKTSKGTNACKVIIEVPEDEEISSTNIDLVRGNITVDNVYSVAIEVKTLVGNISIIDTVSNSAKFIAGVGDIEILSEGLYRISATTTVGNINAQTNDKEYDRTINFTTDDGTIHFFDEISKSSISRNPITKAKTAELKTTSGDIHYNDKRD